MKEFLYQLVPWFAYLSSPATLITSLLIVLSLLYWYGTRGFADLNKLNVPGPKPLPFLGNLLDVRKFGGMHLMLLDYFKTYGKVFAISLGRRPALVIADPEMVKQITTKDFSNFRNRVAVIMIDSPPPLDKMVALCRDGTWKRIRSMLTPTFSAGKIKLMVPFIGRSCDIILAKLDKIADSGQSVEMSDWFSKLTLEVILSTAFGIDANVQMEETNEMVQKAKELFQFPAALFLTLVGLPFVKHFKRFFSSNRVTPEAYFQDIVTRIISARRQQGLSGRKDLLQLLSSAHDETTVEGVSRLTDEEIVAQSIAFLLAGHETSSTTLAFISHHLAVNPDVQDKLRSEIKEAEAANPDMPLYDLAKNIEYLDCVIKEAQRLNSPAAIVNRECDEDYDLGGVHIPAGMGVIIPIYLLHHDPAAWPDPEKFDPERFRGPAKDAHHPYQFLPFGAGPRNCIGMRFALIEIKIALIKILAKYKFVRCPETRVPLVTRMGVTLYARDGVWVRVESAK